MTRPAALLLGPALTGLLLLVLLPLLATLLLAVFRYDALGEPAFVGLEHFRQLAEDPRFRQAAWNSLLIGALAVPLRLTLALLLALAFHRPGPLRLSGLLLIFAPVMVPALVWSLIWLWLLNPHFGPAAFALNALEPLGAQWLLSPWGARTSILAAMALLVGEMVLVLVAVRRLIPHSCYEICAVEGAGALTTFRRVTLPFLLPAIIILAARDIALSFETAMLPSQLITKGGPLFQTYLLPTYIYDSAFEHLRFGYAAAMTGLMLLVTASMISIQFLFLGRWLRGFESGD